MSHRYTGAFYGNPYPSYTTSVSDSSDPYGSGFRPATTGYEYLLNKQAPAQAPAQAPSRTYPTNYSSNNYHLNNHVLYPCYSPNLCYTHSGPSNGPLSGSSYGSLNTSSTYFTGSAYNQK